MSFCDILRYHRLKALPLGHGWGDFVNGWSSKHVHHWIVWVTIKFRQIWPFLDKNSMANNMRRWLPLYSMLILVFLGFWVKLTSLCNTSEWMFALLKVCHIVCWYSIGIRCYSEFAIWRVNEWNRCTMFLNRVHPVLLSLKSANATHYC